MVVNDSMTKWLDSYLRNQAQPATWYLGLVDNSGFTAYAAADLMTSHGGWTEFTGYTATTRPAWGPAAAASQSITNTASVNFAISAAGTVKGVFLVSDNTKGGTAGTLFATANFSAGNQTVAIGDTLQITYTVSMASTS